MRVSVRVRVRVCACTRASKALSANAAPRGPHEDEGGGDVYAPEVRDMGAHQVRGGFIFRGGAHGRPCILGDFHADLQGQPRLDGRLLPPALAVGD
eukprot:36211-Pyramimonas_sp.AAC.1